MYQSQRIIRVRRPCRRKFKVGRIGDGRVCVITDDRDYLSVLRIVKIGVRRPGGIRRYEILAVPDRRRNSVYR